MLPSTPLLIKASTKIAGLIVHPHPLPTLHHLYSRTLHALQSLPPSYIYRSGTEALTQHRLTILETVMLKHGWTKENLGEEKRDAIGEEETVRAQEEVERELGVREVEEVLKVAEGELQLVGKVLEWKSWEPLQVQPPPGQWAQTKLGE